MVIIVTQKAKEKKRINAKKSSERKKRAKICINCKYNDEGYCKKHSAWCGRVNYICLNIEDPYSYKKIHSENIENRIKQKKNKKNNKSKNKKKR